MIVKVINKSKNALPEYKSKGAAGMDIRVNIDAPVTLKPLERYKFPTGLYMEIPHGYFMTIVPRSGLAINDGIDVSNSPAVLDEDFRGEIVVGLSNISDKEFTIYPGDRVAQFVLIKYERVEWVECEELTETERGSGGLGHSGLK